MLMRKSEVARWALSHFAWWLFWLCGAAAVTALASAIADLKGWQETMFVIGIYGVAACALYAASGIAVAMLPERMRHRSSVQQPSGGLTSGLLDIRTAKEAPGGASAHTGRDRLWEEDAYRGEENRPILESKHPQYSE